MKYLLDTCTVSYFFKKSPKVMENLKKCSPHDIAVSFITIMEVEYGLKLNKEKETKIRPIWDKFKNSVLLLPFGEKEAVYAGTLRAYLKEKGRPIGAFDLLIASTAKVNHLICVTSNTKEFKVVPDLKIEDWNG